VFRLRTIGGIQVPAELIRVDTTYDADGNVTASSLTGGGTTETQPPNPARMAVRSGLFRAARPPSPAGLDVAVSDMVNSLVSGELQNFQAGR
jgi:hypothetical protein